MNTPRSLYEKVFDAHVVEAETPERPAVLYIDLHLIHEVTTPQAFTELEARGLKVRRPDRTLATMDHSTPTLPPDAAGVRPYATAQARRQVDLLERNCAAHGITLHDWDSPHRGVVHVIGPELGATQPGMTVVCGDSHTATHGAFGALAFGIGTSEVGHVLATQTLLQRRARPMRVTVDGRLSKGVSAKDLALAIIAELGFGGGTGCVLEYAGDAVRGLDMEGRMTVCNMSIEAGARAGLIAPDATTLAWLYGREAAPKGEAWERAAERWLSLVSDEDAVFDRELRLNAFTLKPMATWGTTPDAAVAIEDAVPQPATTAARKSLDYMRIEAGKPLAGAPVDVVFVGSCTNGRLADLRAAAEVLRGRHVAPGVRMLVAPGLRRRTAGGGGRRPGRGLPGGGRGVAAGRLFHVHRHERRPGGAGPARRLHLQPQLRGPPGPGRAHHPGQSGERGGLGRGRLRRRPPALPRQRGVRS